MIIKWNNYINLSFKFKWSIINLEMGSEKSKNKVWKNLAMEWHGNKSDEIR